MANITIPNLPQATSLTGTEQLLGVQSGTSKSITTFQLLDYITGGTGTLPLPVAAGGTGNITFTNYSLLYGNGTDPIEAIPSPAGANYILVGSPGSAPTWQENIPVTAGVNSITFGSTGLTPSTATEGNVTVAGTLATANGGTNLTSFTANGAVYASSTSVLTTGTLPTASGGTNLTSFNSGGAVYASSSSVLTTGTLPATSGGTGQSSFAVGDLLYADTTTSLSKLADVATGSVLISGGIGVAPSYSTSPTLTTSLTTPLLIGGTTASSSLTLQSTSGVGTSDAISMKVGNAGAITALSINTSGLVTLSSALPVTSGGTGQTSSLTTNGVVYGLSATGMATTAAGTTGQILIATTGGAPSWGAVPSIVAVDSISFGTTGLTPSTATTGAVTVAGTLVAANGGTGQSSYAVGDLLYASTTTALSKLADVATGSVLISGGVGVAPSYSASPTLTTSLTTPLLVGGTGVGSSLTLQSTSGVGATDSVVIKVGNNGAVTAISVATTGIVTFPTTNAVKLPAGTTAQQPTGVTGMIRFNTTDTTFEGYNGTAWAGIGGGAVGGGVNASVSTYTDQVFFINSNTVQSNYTIPTNDNAGSFGPITVNSGVTVTVPSGSTWSIV